MNEPATMSAAMNLRVLLFAPAVSFAMFAGICIAAEVRATIPAKKNGIVLDDSAGEYRGEWVDSAKQQSLIGEGCRHDDNKGQGAKSARFTPEIAEAGEYEVRLIYVATPNRARNVRVTVHGADRDETVTVNQREPVLVHGVPRALGAFRFAKGRSGFVEISNEAADGFVVVDGVQFVPLAVAQEERAGKISAGFGAADTAPRGENAGGISRAAAVAVLPLTKLAPGNATAARSDEAVNLAKDATPASVNGKSYDLVVVGATVGGVVCAVRAAREGCTVLLVRHNRHIGGMLANGLMQWDALYGGPRASIFTELLRNIERDAVNRFGRTRRATRPRATRMSIIPSAGWSRM